MSIPSIVFDNGNRSNKLSLKTSTGEVVLGEEVLIDESIGLSRSIWRGTLQSIGTPFCTVNGQTVIEGNVRKIVG